jgi:hypothetical protein
MTPTLTTRTLTALALALGLAGATAATGHAAVPNSTIKGWQDSAPEAVEVTVLSVRDDTQAQPVAGQPNCTQTRHELTVTAKVDVVHRTAGGLQAGRTITFHDSAMRIGPCILPGMSFGAIWTVGDHVDAYLRPAGTADGAFIANHTQKLR